MAKIQQYDTATLMLDRASRLLARKRAHGVLRGQTAILIKEAARLRKEWSKHSPRER